ncbi:MAG: sodium-independent anion transporter, partial [Alphaproteobacteria bacterium]|nr:sodium-independent anion transporter [Alphaproteobacteria bacterium]
MIKSNLEKFKKFCKKNFTPKLVEVFKKRYTKADFRRDTLAALTVAVVSIPLAMAFAIASGVSPAQGLYTAIIAGFFVSLLGGSRYQIGGPTGAFIIIILGVLQQHGFNGLLVTMILAGLILIVAGLLRLGTYIKYIPYPVVTGFTAGIGMILISTQIKDLFGLTLDVPAPFLQKWMAYFKNIGTLNWFTVLISIVAFSSIMLIKKRWPKSPFYLISVVISTLIVVIFT